MLIKDEMLATAIQRSLHKQNQELTKEDLCSLTKPIFYTFIIKVNDLKFNNSHK